MINREKKLLFIHIPKNAGTSIERSLFKDFSFSNNFSKDILFGYDKNTCINLQHATVEQLLEYRYISRKDLCEFNSFAIVRNPFSRALSGYFWLMRDLSIKDSFTNFLLEKGAFSKLNLSFQNKHVLDHFYTQSEFVLVDNNIGVKDLLKFENLPTDFKHYMDKMGFNYKLGGHFKKNNKGKLELMKYLTKENVSIIQEKYKVDFENFGYNPNFNRFIYFFRNG